MKKYLKVDAAATTTKVMNTKTQKESANRDWRDYEWRIVVRFDWTCEDGTEDVDIMGYAYDTKQDAIMDIRRALDVYIDYFRDEEGHRVNVLENKEGVLYIPVEESSLFFDYSVEKTENGLILSKVDYDLFVDINTKTFYSSHIFSNAFESFMVTTPRDRVTIFSF
jgi:hypothetical protein